MERGPGLGMIVGLLVMSAIWQGNLLSVFAESGYDCSQGAHKYEVVIAKAAQEDEDGVRSYTCLLCGTSYTEVISRYGHLYGEWMEEQKATCTQPGSRYRTCIQYSHQAQQRETIKALGHQYGAWETLQKAEAGMTGQKIQTCSLCGTQRRKEIPALPLVVQEKQVKQGWNITLEQAIGGVNLLVFLILGFLIWSDIQVLLWYRRITRKGSDGYV